MVEGDGVLGLGSTRGEGKRGAGGVRTDGFGEGGVRTGRSSSGERGDTGDGAGEQWWRR